MDCGMGIAHLDGQWEDDVSGVAVVALLLLFVLLLSVSALNGY